MKYRRFKEGTSRKAEPAPLKDIINEMLEVYKLKKRLSETELMDSWGRIMGGTIARRTTALFIKDGKLFVKLNSAPLRQELSMAKQKILNLLHEDLKEEIVNDVVFL